MTTNPSTPQRLYLMQVAFLPSLNMPAVCYLIQTSDGTNILIDSGLPEQLPPGMPVVLGTNVIEQLADIGLQPGDINQVICTHFDIDHAGNHRAFTNAEFIVQRTHYDMAQTNERFAITRPYWLQPTLRFRFVEGDTQLLPGLELIETSGHTLGHQSVLVRLPETGPVLLTIDAVSDQARFTPDHSAGPRDDDEVALRASTRKLLDLVQREKVALVIFGHDLRQWETLKKTPDYYC